LKEVLSTGAEYFTAGNSEDLQAKLILLIQDEKKRKELSRLGKTRAMEFQTEDSSRRLLEIYKRLAP
jgi:glycosyltransferase involved in cell wall biosynthesis